MSGYRLPPELPQLAHLLDPATVEQLASSEPLTGLGLAQPRLTHVRYRPEENCVLTWRVRTAQANAAWLSILACRQGRSREDYQASVNTCSSSIPSPEIVHLARFDAVLRVFPAERKLSGVRWLARPAQLVKELGGSLHGTYREGGLVIRHYVAERSCTVRLASDAVTPAAYGKFHRPGESGQAWQLINNLWNARSKQTKTQAGLVVPEPLAWHSASESVWVGELPGAPLDLSVSDFQLKEIGRTLAALHRVRLKPAPRSFTPPGLELHRKIPLLTALRPDLHARLHDFTSRVVRLDPSTSGNLATLHGDLHPRNIIVLPDGRIGLIDFDNLGCGDPLLDLGSLAAYLHYRDLCIDHRLAPDSSQETSRKIRLICRGYEEESGQQIDPFRLRFRTAASLINERAWRTLTRLRPDGARMIEELLILAEGMVSE